MRLADSCRETPFSTPPPQTRRDNRFLSFFRSYLESHHSHGSPTRRTARGYDRKIDLGNAGRRQQGIVAGTRVATHQGWRPVESLMQGDLLATFDSGFQPVEAITQHRAWIAATPLRKRAAPLHVARGVLRNRRDMMVLPGQPVMIESDAAERLLGDPFAVVPARALLGLAGVEPWQLDIPVDILVLRMARDELVYVDGGALVLAGAADAQGQNPGSRRRDTGARYGVLGGELAQLVVQLQGGSDFGLPGDAA